MEHLAQAPTQPFGTVDSPPGVSRFDTQAGGSPGGLSILFNIILRSLIVLASVYAVINFVLAGYGYMSAGGDPKKIQDAGAKIWQTMIGLLVAAGAFVIAAIIGRLIFGDYRALLQLQIFEPR